MGEYNRLAKNTVVFAIGQFSVKLIQFFLMPIVTAVMTAEDYGSAETLISLTELLLPLLTLGLQDAVFRFTMKDDISNESIISSTMAIIMSGFLLIVLGSALSSFFFDFRLSLLFAGIYMCYMLSNVWGQYIKGNGYVKTFAACGVIQALVLAAATFLLVYHLKLGKYGYLLALFIAYASSLSIMFFFGKLYKSIRWRFIDKTILKEMLKYSLPLIPNNISWWFVQVINRYIVIAFLGEATSGLYISTLKIATIINIFGTIFLQAWTISTVKSVNSEDKAEFNTKIYKLYSTFIQMAELGLLLVLPFVSGFLLKGEFADSWRYSAMSIFTAILSCYCSFFGAYYGANMNTKMSFYSTLLGAITNTAMCLLLTWLFGLYGTLFASVIGYLVMAIFRMATTQKYSMIHVNVYVEILAMLLALLDAILVLVGKNLPILWYYAGQTIIIVMFMVVKYKNIKEVVLFIKNAIIRFINKNNTNKGERVDECNN